MGNIKFRLSVLNFLEFAVWGSYLTSLGNFLSACGMQDDIKWFYAIQGIVSLLMPSIVGIIADRWIQAQKMLSLCHVIAGGFMALAGWYCVSHISGMDWITLPGGELKFHITNNIEFGTLFTLYAVSVAFFMPTIGLNNSVAFNAMEKQGLDTVKDFPPIRIFGTVGFICAMLISNFATTSFGVTTGVQFQSSFMQLFLSAGFSLLMVFYALTMPKCPCCKDCPQGNWIDKLGLRAFALFKQKKMAVFFIFSMMLGVSLQITNGFANPYISSFKGVAEYAGAWAAQNANALISLSQLSETLCILLIPFCLKRFGIKGVMLMSMFAWVFRFGFFGVGNPAGGLWMFILSCIVYGIAFDFFNVSGGLYVDKETSPSIRSSAQGLFMIMTNGLGATLGTLAAGEIVSHFVNTADPTNIQLEGWRTSWLIFAAYALVVAILFWIIFRDDTDSRKSTIKEIKEAEGAETHAFGFVTGDDFNQTKE